MNKDIYILAIESSCDDTSASVIKNREILSNVVATQDVHKAYGGVVPELASRAHQQNIVPVVHQALEKANIAKESLNAIAFTQGPGLMGSLLVGSSFANSLAMALNIPLIAVNHMQGHILAHFIDDGKDHPNFPFLCLTVSGGHTQIVKVEDHFDMTILGETLDDAVGEAYDKTAKMLGLDYPGGPILDKLAQKGNPKAFKLTKPKVGELEFSFSGLKTNILQLIQREEKKNPNFKVEQLENICASVQYTIIGILMDKLQIAAQKTGLKEIAIAGGVSANSALREQLQKREKSHQWKVFIPKFEFCTDNAAMIAIAAYYKYQKNEFVNISTTANSRLKF